MTRVRPRPASPRTAGAFTLAEIVLFTAIALWVLVVVVSLLTRGERLFFMTTQQVAVSVDARALFENVVSDIRTACALESPRSAAEWSRDRTLQLYRFASNDATVRVRKNIEEERRTTYPHQADGDLTIGSLDVQRVTYRLVPQEGSGRSYRIEREEVGGFLDTIVDGASGDSRRVFMRDGRVGARNPGAPTCLASHVKTFDIVPLAVVFDHASSRWKTVRVGTDGTTQDQVALVIIVYSARRQVEGQTTPEGTIDFTTKVWLEEKAYELRFPEFFSSVDANLTF